MNYYKLPSCFSESILVNVTVIMILWLRGSRGKLFYTMKKKNKKKRKNCVVQTDPQMKMYLRIFSKSCQFRLGLCVLDMLTSTKRWDKPWLRSLFSGRIGLAASSHACWLVTLVSVSDAPTFSNQLCRLEVQNVFKHKCVFYLFPFNLSTSRITD